MKILLNTLIFSFFISFYVTAQNASSAEVSFENKIISSTTHSLSAPGNPDPYPCTPCMEYRLMLGGGFVYPRRGPVFYIGAAQNKGSYSIQYQLKYSEPITVINGSDFKYQKLELPAMIYWNPGRNVSVGGGIQGDLLLSSTVKGVKQDLSKEYKKYGYGLVVGAEVGAKNRGPRVGVHYAQHFGAGSIARKSYSTLELTLRVQLGKKP